MVKDIRFENNAGIKGGQSPAIQIDSNNKIYSRCSFKDFHDTLYIANGRQFYKNCDAYGIVDSVF